ncbi:uncharacterized protein LOC111244265 isoform X1 [Varroa destructor]|uniref:RCC1-like domain-containing protein n=2 Tax=Varroa destructor TaxID=109461 RepID=A0A7M7JIQ3_VARDE|nr:uncharacterized protein LOC111244265 isoform X1 [Varroa destructor]
MLTSKQRSLSDASFGPRNVDSGDVTSHKDDSRPADGSCSTTMNAPLDVELYTIRNVLRLPIGVTIQKAVSHSTHSRIAIAALCSNGTVIAFTEHNGRRRIKQWRAGDSENLRLLLDPSCHNVVLISSSGVIQLLALVTSPAVQPFQTLQGEVVFSKHAKGSALTDACCWETCTGVPMVILGFENRDLLFVEISTGEVLYRTTSPLPIDSILVCHSDYHRHRRLLVVQTSFGQKTHLCIESRSEPRIVFPPDHRVVFLPLGKFNVDVELSSQGDLVKAFNKRTSTLSVYDSDVLVGEPTHVIDLSEKFKLPKMTAGSLIVMWQDLMYISSETKLYLLSQPPASITSKKQQQHQQQQQDKVSPLLAEYNMQASIVNTHASLYATPDVTEAKENGCSSVDIVPPAVFVTTRDSIQLLAPACSLQKAFVQLATESSTAQCEHFINLFPRLSPLRLYEMAAEIELRRNNFTKAIKLYQTSKCGQLKRIAHFVSSGSLAELLAYSQVVFSTRCHELQQVDRPHLANFAVLCFVHQLLEKHDQREVITNAFRTFLVDNVYYSDIVVIRTLCNFKLYSLLSYFSRLHNQLALMADFLFKNLQGPSDTQVCQSYSAATLKQEQTAIQECLTGHPEMVLALCTSPGLLARYLRTCCDLLQISDCTHKLAALFDPSKPCNKLAIRKLFLTPKRQRCAKSETSLISADSLDASSLDASDDPSLVSEQDVLKLFLFVLLLLNRNAAQEQNDISNGNAFNGEGHSNNWEHNNKPEFQSALIRVFEFHPQPSRAITPVGIHLAAGPSYAALCARGKAYVWGTNRAGRFGEGEPSFGETISPQRVSYLDLLRVNVTQVACGTMHTLFLTDHGVFASGASNFGQLGLGLEVRRSQHPQLVEAFHEHSVKQVVCGAYHSMALTHAGKVFCWGWGVHGQLGQGSTNDYFLPAAVKGFPATPIQVGAGGAHSIVLCHDGRVVAFGCNAFGQLGLGNRTKFSRPQLVRLPTNSISMIAVGFFQTYALSTKPAYRIYTWGCNPQSLRLQAQSQKRFRQQQQGSGNANGSKGSSDDSSNPMAYLSPSLLCDLSHGVASMSAGYNHVALVTTRGELLTAGRNSEGQLGHGHRKDIATPTAISSLANRQMVSVACGKDFTLAVDNTGKVMAWGQNDSSQLALKTVIHVKEPEATNRVIMVRTARRVINIPHVLKHGELKPVPCSGLPPEVAQAHIPNVDISEMEMSARQRLFFATHSERLLNCPPLSLMDPTPYVGGAALHATLAIFHSSYDSALMLEHCDSLGDHQAAAKIALLEGRLTKALEHQLKAVKRCKNPKSSLKEVLDYYCSRVDDTMSSESIKAFLNLAITAWIEMLFDVSELEAILTTHLDRIGLALGLLLFCDAKAVAEVCLGVEGVAENFSPEFNERLMDLVNGAMNSPEGDVAACQGIIEVTGCGKILDDIRREDAMTTSSSEKFRKKLASQVRQKIKQNSMPPAPIVVSSLDAKRLVQAAGGPAVVFSCGHHAPSSQVELSSLGTSLPSDQLDRVTSLYATQGRPIPLACPSCVLERLSSSSLHEDSATSIYAAATAATNSTPAASQ